ncbi:MAG: VOC family protein [Actinomycetota bacterium]
MPVPQRVSIVTLGARDLASLRSFYGRWGWTETDEAGEMWTAFDVGGWLLSLFPLDLLGDEAAPGAPVPAAGWNGVTFAINVSAEDELRSVFDAAVAAGATIVAPITRREWGGTSGYVADPEGNRWELAVGSGSD